MIFAIDVQYDDTRATAAGILFSHWECAQPECVIVREIEGIAAYEPGSFYKRELPCVMHLLQEVDSKLEAIVIDGYVGLGAEQRPGLGMHLYQELREAIPVIGVAKSFFWGTPPECELQRGNSQKPLYITAAGMALTEAKARIALMHGEYRIPTLLKKVDQLCRGTSS